MRARNAREFVCLDTPAMTASPHRQGPQIAEKQTAAHA